MTSLASCIRAAVNSTAVWRSATDPYPAGRVIPMDPPTTCCHAGARCSRTGSSARGQGFLSRPACPPEGQGPCLAQGTPGLWSTLVPASSRRNAVSPRCAAAGSQYRSPMSGALVIPHRHIFTSHRTFRASCGSLLSPQPAEAPAEPGLAQPGPVAPELLARPATQHAAYGQSPSAAKGLGLSALVHPSRLAPLSRGSATPPTWLFCASTGSCS